MQTGKMTISADGVGTMNGFNVKSTGNTTNDSDKATKTSLMVKL